MAAGDVRLRDGSESSRAFAWPEDRSAAVGVDALAEHGPLLLAAARVITLDESEAQDLVQATLEIAIRRLDTLRSPGALRAWLLRIETREAVRVVRRLRRVMRLDARVVELAAPDADVTARLAVRQALARLPRRTRAAVVLHHMAGMSVADTAETLGVSPNTIKTELKAGLAKLREYLRDG